MKTIGKVREDALALPINERAALAHDLIVSLDDPSDCALSPEEESEIARKVRKARSDYKSGKVTKGAVADLMKDLRS